MITKGETMGRDTLEAWDENTHTTNIENGWGVSKEQHVYYL